MNSTNVAVAMGGGQPIDPKAIAAATKKPSGNSASSDPPKLFEVKILFGEKDEKLLFSNFCFNFFHEFLLTVV